MFSKLLLLFIFVPIIELMLLIEMGQWVGTLPTLGLIALTGIVGAYLARRQGVQVLARMQNKIKTGQLPTDAIFDGAIILIAGAFLMTPGVLTDTIGFLCLIPATRQIIKNNIRSRIEQKIQSGHIYTSTYQRSYQPPEDVIIIDPEDR